MRPDMATSIDERIFCSVKGADIIHSVVYPWASTSPHNASSVDGEVIIRRSRF